ncbi:MAG: hypothetical protein HONBIEJF_01137 [Fimbriimonadaceae bacterium]|nr:hypothetical protein [Fimbriimonadaceae bacterium]
MTRRLFWTLLATASASLAAVAQPMNYALDTVPVRAGALLIESQKVGGSPTKSAVAANVSPHVFHYLDLDRNAKPAGWTYLNPHANSVLTSAVRDRWTTIPNAGNIPPVGTKLDKNMAPYWEVSLSSMSDQALSDYDILMLAINGNLALNSIEREKLRRYVDQGGILWVDFIPGSVVIDSLNCLPLPLFLGNGGGTIGWNPGHPVFNTPNTLGYDELYRIGINSGQVVVPIPDSVIGPFGPIMAWLKSDFLRFDPVAFDNSGGVVLVGRIGEGAVVITSRGTSGNLNRGYDVAGNNVPNQTFYAAPRSASDASFVAGSKLIINATTLSSTYTSVAKGSRRSNGGPIDITAPLMRRFTARGLGSNLSPSNAPVVFKGYVVFTAGDRVVVLDSVPGRDTDGNGNPDDGIVDPTDYPADIVWISQSLSAPLSMPTCTEVPEVATLRNPLLGNTPVTDQILVCDGQGRLNIFDLQYDPNGGAALGNVPPLAVANPPETTQFGPAGPQPPTAHEGLAFVADARADGNVTGRCWVVDLRTGLPIISQKAWSISQSARFAVPSAPPTVGYVPILDNSGGVDKVVYIPMVNNPTGAGGQPRAAGFVSIWFGARGEKPSLVSEEPDALRLTTRASQQGLPIFLPGGNSHLGVKVSVLQANGQPYSTDITKTFFDGSRPLVVQDSNGELTIPLSATGSGRDWTNSTPTLLDDASIRLDYTIDWGAVGFGSNNAPADAYIRGNLQLPDDSGLTRQIIGGVALGPTGNLFVVTGSPINTNGDPIDRSKGGSLFCIREDGRGRFKLVYRWDLFRRHVIKINSGISTGDRFTYDETLYDEDELGKVFAPLGGALNDPCFASGPTVKGDTVYVTATGLKRNPFEIPMAILLAFEATPQPAEFFLENVSGNFVLSQRDYARSSNKAEPEIYSDLRQGQYTIERDPNTGRTRVRLESMMDVEQGQVRNALSTNLPIVVRGGGQGASDAIVEPELTDATIDTQNQGFVPGFAGGRWTPLRWYTVFAALYAPSQPLVTGETVYLAGSSAVPGIFAGQGFFNRNGLLTAMDSTISQNDPFLVATTGRRWNSQLKQFKDVNMNNNPPFKINPAIRWPQAFGVQSFEDYAVRFLQTAVDEPRAMGVVGGDGVLVTWGTSTVYGYSRGDFMVADEGRVGRFDASGNPVWLVDGSVQAGLNGPISTVGKGIALSRPNRVYQVGPNSYWVVDNGNDRIMRIDGAGREVRTITGFKFDPKYRPSGAPDNIRSSLRLPKDILVYESYEQNPSYLTSPRPLERWVHYLIADAGNYRIVELIDRYEVDPVSRRVLGPVEYVDPQSDKPNQIERAQSVLFWHTPAELSGKQYAYNSIDRVFVDDGSGGRIPVVAFGFGNFEPGKASFGLDNTNQNVDSSSGFGGIVLYNGAQTTVITKVAIPAIPANAFFQDATNAWDSPARPAVERKIAGLTSVSLRYTTYNNLPVIAIMFTDSSGVYEVIETAPGVWTTRWYLPNEAFRAIRNGGLSGTIGGSNPMNARPVYARRLDSGEVVVVNGWQGVTRNKSVYNGEIVLLEGEFAPTNNDRGFNWNKRNLGFDSLSVKAEISQVQGARGIMAPLFGDRR